MTIIASIETIFVGVAALSSAVAVLVALFGWRLRRPVLSLLPFSGTAPDGALVYGKDGIASAWLRLRVHNERGRLPARQTEVSLVAVSRLGGQRSERLRDLEVRHSGNRLVADHEQLLIGYSLKWADRPDDRIDIAGGTQRLVDIVCLVEAPEKRHLSLPIWEGEDWWHGADDPRKKSHRPDSRHHLYWPAYAMAVALSCADAAPVFYSFELRWDDKWPDDDGEIWEHLRIEALRRHRKWPPRPSLSQRAPADSPHESGASTIPRRSFGRVGLLRGLRFHGLSLVRMRQFKRAGILCQVLGGLGEPGTLLGSRFTSDQA